jgi:hypothetical protein
MRLQKLSFTTQVVEMTNDPLEVLIIQEITKRLSGSIQKEADKVGLETGIRAYINMAISYDNKSIRKLAGKMSNSTDPFTSIGLFKMKYIGQEPSDYHINLVEYFKGDDEV